MAIKFQCDKCGAQLKAPDEYAGHESKCLKCQATVIVPGEQAIVVPPIKHSFSPSLAEVRTTEKRLAQQQADAITKVCETANYEWSVRLAGVLSFFVVGAGQVYKGDIARGLIQVLMQAALFFAVMRIGFVDGPKGLIAVFASAGLIGNWAFSIFDACSVPRLQLGKLTHATHE